VRTGNFKGKGNSELYPAKRVFDDVEQAVEWIVQREDIRFWNLVQSQGWRTEAMDEEGYLSDTD
jgi:hypothetical protein